MFDKKIITVVEIEGMKCENCAKHVTNAFQEIDSVKKVVVDLKKKTATITSTKKIEEDILKDKVEELGYRFLGVKGV